MDSFFFGKQIWTVECKDERLECNGRDLPVFGPEKARVLSDWVAHGVFRMNFNMRNYVTAKLYFHLPFKVHSICVVKLKVLIGNLFVLSNAGTAIDQGIAYVLLLVALAITYLIH